jgi:hypothetical protein
MRAALGRTKSGGEDGGVVGDSAAVVLLDRAWLPERWTRVDGGALGAGRSGRPNRGSSAQGARPHEEAMGLYQKMGHKRGVSASLRELEFIAYELGEGAGVA